MNLLESSQVDGFIIAAPEGSRELLTQLKKFNTPTVMIDRYFKDFDSPYVIVDNFNASAQATNYLLHKGHEKIASVMYDSQLAHFKDRCDGYLEALKKSKNMVTNSFIEKVGQLSVKRDMKKTIKKLVFEDNIDAIYFQANTLAEEGIKQWMDLGKDVLNTIDFVVFNLNSTYHFLGNFIPYINQPIKKMGQKSVSIVIDQIEGKNAIKNQFQLETGKIETT